MRTLAILSIALAAGCIPYTVGEDHVLHARRDADPTRPVLDPEAVRAAVPGTTVEAFPVQAADGTRLGGVHVRHAAPDPGRLTVLYFGGNSFRVEWLGMKKLVPILRLGADVVMVDHRGYGRSAGTASVDSLKADALAVFDAVAGHVGAERVVVHGHSLGSFLASHVGANRDAGGVVLENSATTTEAYAASRFDFYPILRPFVQLEISEALEGEGSLAPVRRIASPLLIVAGALDARIPAWMSGELYAASPLPEGEKRLAVFASVGHNGVPTHRDFPAVYRAFLDAVRLGASAP